MKALAALFDAKFWQIIMMNYYTGPNIDSYIEAVDVVAKLYPWERTQALALFCEEVFK